MEKRKRSNFRTTTKQKLSIHSPTELDLHSFHCGSKCFVIVLLILPSRNAWDKQHRATIYHANADSWCCAGKCPYTRQSELIAKQPLQQLLTPWDEHDGSWSGHISPAVGISHELLQVINVWLFYFENHTAVSRQQSSVWFLLKSIPLKHSALHVVE